ncbi:MAG: hypothetical protein HYZ72_07635 [Deltaproteobacteria bacterium]|nr:hypothetical protein [Deltaproteobacteria bacterium]
MREEKVRLALGYNLRVADLLREVEVADNFTLGDLCVMIRDCEEMDLETFSALVRCPLAPFLAECLQPCDTTTALESHLSYIRLRWRCEYDSPAETLWPPSSSLWLDVDGIGDIWEDYKPGGQFYEQGKDYSHCNQYALEMTPLYELRHLPLRIDPTMAVACTAETGKEPLEIPAPGVTLLQLIYSLFWELSFFGTPGERDAKREELQETARRIEAGEEKLTPWEDIWKESEDAESSRRSRS